MQQKNREYFLARAAELELAASTAPTPTISEGYLELARTFRELADEGAVGGGLKTVTNETTRPKSDAE